MPADNPKSGKPGKSFCVPWVTYLGEQDGPAERELKSRLTHLLRNELSICRAYLARVKYGGSEGSGVALCLGGEWAPDHHVVDKVGEIFASMFGRQEHLDIVFLDEDEEAELAKTCKPFFDLGSSTPRRELV